MFSIIDDGVPLAVFLRFYDAIIFTSAFGQSKAYAESEIRFAMILFCGLNWIFW